MEGKTPKKLSSHKVGILGEFTEHAAEVGKDIKELERTFANPSTFFGTTRRHKSAHEILTNEIKSLKKTRDEVHNLLDELRSSEEENASLLSEVELFSAEMNDLKVHLEGKGFSFTSGHNDSITSVSDSLKNTDLQRNTAVEVISEATEDSGNIEMNRTQPSECVEKYLEDNNLELDDLVTPYIQRKSCLLSRRTD